MKYYYMVIFMCDNKPRRTMIVTNSEIKYQNDIFKIDKYIENNISRKDSLVVHYQLLRSEYNDYDRIDVCI